MKENKLLIRIGVIMAAGLFVCIFGQAAQAAIVQVGGTCKGTLATYSTIGSAISSVPAGSTIWVCPGVYAEQLKITKNLTLEGASSGNADAAIIIPPAGGLTQNASDPAPGVGLPNVAAQIAVVGPATVNISHLTIDGTGNGVNGNLLLVGIYYLNASGNITFNALRFQTQATNTGDQNGLAIYVESGGGAASKTTINTNTVTNYEKNGITANGFGDGTAGPAATVENNVVVGQGATTGAAENGIQLAFGATGRITGNTTLDDIWGPDTSSDTGDAAAGILVYASSGTVISGNTVGSAQFGISVDSDPNFGSGDNNTISSNKVDGTQIFDGIDLCSDGNTVNSNVVDIATSSGIHADDSCKEPDGSTTGNNNSMTKDTINTACAGILEGASATGTLITAPILYFNDVNEVMTGSDLCTAPTGTGPAAMKTAASAQSNRRLRPSPFR